MHERVQDQKNRLFNDTLQTTLQSPYKHAIVLRISGAGNSAPGANNINGVSKISENKPLQTLNQQLETTSSGVTASKEFAPRVLFTISSTPFKCPNSHNHSSNTSIQNAIPKRRSSPVSVIKESQTKKTEEVPTIKDNDKILPSLKESITEENVETSVANNVSSHLEISPNKNKQYNAEKNQLLNSAMMNIEKAFEKTSHLTGVSQDDSGNYSRNENCDGSSTSYTSSSDLTNVDTTNSLNKVNDNQKSINQSNSSIELTEDAVPELMCERLCSLLKEQLVKCLNEIREKYYKDDQLNLSDVVELDLINNDDQTIQTVIEIEDTTVGVETHKNSLNCIKMKDNEDTKDVVAQSVKTQNTVTELQAISSPREDENKSIAADEEVRRISEASFDLLDANQECFQVLSNAPKNHKFHLTIFHPNNTQQYYKAVQREHRMLKSSLPPGVYVKVYEDRMDLLSVMIEGPKHTPYEDGMFFFDIQLGRDYPKSPPLCHYISYCSDRLNPNLYEDGKVCVSLLGTWMGKDTEMWGPNSTLLQVIVSIQGLILVAEPYFNEAGYEKQKGTQQGKENSRMYNEMVIIKMVQATAKLIQNTPEVFHKEISNHFKENGLKMYARIKGWMELSKASIESEKNCQDSNKNAKHLLPNCDPYSLPDFPLIPASRGFCLTLAGLLESLKQKIQSLNDTVVAPNKTPNLEASESTTIE
ncbi:hypothetical protein DOY81_009065 [Sarcophaga bullata]|nr:hypothetical protein DOY81_009065 [Sarcophaga bullata]